MSIYSKKQISRAESYLTQTDERRNWWQELKDFDPTPLDLGERIEELFRKAKNIGIDRDTATLMVRVTAQKQCFPYDDQQILNRAAAAYSRRGKPEFEEDELVYHRSNPIVSNKTLPTQKGEKET